VTETGFHVTVSVSGRFWAFNLASQLHRRGHLRRLITTYPKFEAAKYGTPQSHTVSHLPLELITRLFQKAPEWCRRHYNPEYAVDEMVDRAASLRIPRDTRIFVGWSSVSLHSMRRAKAIGAVTLLERGSSHMRYQTDILKEEYARFGLRPVVAHTRVFEKELQEYEEADFIVVPSSFVKRTFLDEGIPETKVVQIPFGVDLAEFRPVPKEDKIFRVIFVGGLVLRKGVHYLLRAFHELNLPNAELWLIGSLGDEIVPFLKKYDNGRVFHKGPYRQSELYRYYSQGSVFCLASIEEGLAMVILQAMACGLPVVCTENSGGADIVREGKEGFVVPIRDVTSLKERIMCLYENQDQCRVMGQSARNRVAEGLSWDHYGNLVSDMYAEILGRNEF
jgi:glycosyltransferase involved in cell wall biosynthesis